MKQREHHIGPGAVSLLLIIVVVSMSVLGLLSLISARGDYKLTERAITLTTAGYSASAEAEERMAELDAVLIACSKECAGDAEYLQVIEEMLPEEMGIDGRVVYWEESVLGGRTLSCSVEILPLGEQQRFAWKKQAFSAGGNAGDEWAGQ